MNARPDGFSFRLTLTECVCVQGGVKARTQRWRLWCVTLLSVTSGTVVKEALCPSVLPSRFSNRDCTRYDGAPRATDRSQRTHHATHRLSSFFS